MGKRIAIYLIGLAINALGIALIIFSTAGAGSWDAVAIGMNHYVGLTIGTCTVLIQVLLIITTAIIEKKRLQYEAIITIMIRSAFLDAWVYLVFDSIQISSSWAMQWFIFTLGFISIGVGIGIYIEAHFPKSPVDGLMLALHQRFSWSINVSRIIVESAGVLLGFILGGPVGVGTVIIALFIGNIIQLTNRKVKEFINYESMKNVVLHQK